MRKKVKQELFCDVNQNHQIVSNINNGHHNNIYCMYD